MDRIESYVIDALRGYDPERIIIFGSRARGDARRHSDVDLLIVKDDPRRPVERIWDVQTRLYDEARRDEWRDLGPFDTYVFTPSEVADGVALGDWFFEEVLREGRVIFDRDRDAA